MPIGINSPARNLFLLGSSGAQLVTNFFESIDQSASSDSNYLPEEIRYYETLSEEDRFVLSGSANDNNLIRYGWFEDRSTSGVASYSNKIQSTQNEDTYLRALELDSNNNLIAVGKTGTIPWISKYTIDGVIDWQSTTNSADVEYTGIASDSNGQYYACGSSTSGKAFVEKFDANGNPGWGKSAFMLGRNVSLGKIDANSRGHVVAVGYLEDDTNDKGYIIKIDTNTGEVLWDRTIETDRNVRCSDIFIDDNDIIYITANLTYPVSGTPTGCLLKYTAEGNLLWQTESDCPDNDQIEFSRVQVDGETQSVVVFGFYRNNTTSKDFGLLSKYAKDGSLVWRRTIESSESSGAFFETPAVDSTATYYYILFTDQSNSPGGSLPDRYTFAKLSSSGNGLGAFQYNDGTGETMDYVYSNLTDKLAKLVDGSVRNDTSDLITYPFSANKLLFDDLATQVSNKKRQMDSADSFEYSGSPAIRVADFQELNLLGDVYSGSGDWLDQSDKGNDGIMPGIWIKTLGSSDSSYGSTIDNNYFYTAGMVQSEGQGSRDAYMSKWNFNGSLVWQKIIGLAGLDQFAGIAVDSNGNVYGFGNTNSIVSGENNILVVKLDSNGSQVWQKIYGSSTNNVSVTNPIIDYSGNIIFGIRDGFGATAIFSNIKIDVDGNIIWQYNYSVPVSVSLLNSDNSFYSLTYYPDDSTYGLTLVDSNGSIVSQSSFGINYPIQLFNVVRRPNGNFVFLGSEFDNSVSPSTSTLTLVEYNSQLNLINNKTYIETSIGYHYINAGVLDSKGNLYAVGLRYDSSVGSASYEPLAFKFNTDLEIEWAVTLGGNSNGLDLAYDIEISPDEKHIYITGFWRTNGTYRHNHFKIRTDNGIFPGTYGSIIVGNHSYSGPTTQTFPAGNLITNTITKSASSFSVSNTSLTLANSALTITNELDTDPIYNADGYWEFDGVDDYIQLTTNSDLTFAGDFSYETWLWTDVQPASNTIWSLPNGQTFQFTTLNSQQQIIYYSGPTGNQAFGNLPNNTWAHYIITKSGNTITGYLNGVQSWTVTPGSSETHNFSGSSIGYRTISPAGFYWDGKIGEVRIYPRALTAAQVYQNYNATKSKYINEAPDTAPKIGPGIVYDSNLLLNYDFGNRATYDRAENLSAYSENFTLNNISTGWRTDAPQYSRATLIANTGIDSPVGTNNASRWQSGNQTTQELIYHILPTALTIGETYTVSCWVRRVESFGNVEFYLGDNITLDVTSQVDAVPFGEWVRVSATRTITGQNGNPIRNYIAVRPNGNVDGGDKTTIDIWGMNVNRGSTVGRYIKTSGTAITAPTTVKNLSSNSFPGTIYSGIYNADGYFTDNGTNFYIGSNINTSLSGGTMEAWIWFDNVNQNQGMFQIGPGSVGPYINFYSPGASSQKMRWEVIANTVNPYTTILSNTNLVTGQWYHFVGTFDGASTTTLYVNGTQDIQQTNMSNQPTSVNAQVAIGNYAGALDGRIGEVRFYNRDLSATEVSQNFNATRSKYGV